MAVLPTTLQVQVHKRLSLKFNYLRPYFIIMSIIIITGLFTKALIRPFIAELLRIWVWRIWPPTVLLYCYLLGSGIDSFPVSVLDTNAVFSDAPI